MGRLGLRRRYQRFLVALLGASTVVTPIVVTQLIGSSTPAAATTYDTITYVQTSGAKGTYLQFKNAAGTTVVNQSITSGGGGCSNPSINSNTPLLQFSANEYSNPGGYTGTPAAAGTATVGAYQQRTGVCFTPQAWSIENLEGLDFSVGSYPKYAAGRVFNDAQLNIERWNDKTGSGTLTVQLAEWLGGSQVALENCVIGATGSITLLDTNPAAGTCTVVQGTDPSNGFDRVEVRNLLVGGSISVVGPTSKFSLENQICGGDPTLTVHSTDGSGTEGNITANLTLTGTSSQCKSYTTFSATTSNVDGFQAVEFDGNSIGNVPFTVSVTWANFDPACTPTDNGTGMPVCPLTEFELNGQTTFSPATFCSSASAGDPLCVTSRDYSYVPEPAGSDDVGGVSDDGPGSAEQNSDLTQITETWSGYIDWIGRS